MRAVNTPSQEVRTGVHRKCRDQLEEQGRGHAMDKSSRDCDRLTTGATPQHRSSSVMSGKRHKCRGMFVAEDMAAVKVVQ